MAKINAWGSDDPAEETKGGTGQSSYTTGDVLYSSASNTLSKLGIGSEDDVLTVSAGGIPEWVTPATAGPNGVWVELSNQTASASSTIEYTGLSSTYKVYRIEIDDLEPTTYNTTSRLVVRFSDDTGSTWEQGASDYSYEIYGTRVGTVQTKSSTGDDQIELHKQDVNITRLGNASGDTGNATLWLYSPADSGVITTMAWQVGARDGSIFWRKDGWGAYLTESAIDGIQFRIVSGTIASGNFRIYGLKGS